MHPLESYLRLAHLAFAVLFTSTSLIFGQVTNQSRNQEVDDVSLKDLPNGLTRVSWSAVDPSCEYSVTYSVYRDTKEDFVPSKTNQIASGITTTHYDARETSPGSDSFYRVEAIKGPAPKTLLTGKPPGRSSSIRGRVFAITQGGDIKPARLATVNLVFEARTIGHRVDKKFDCEQTAYTAFLQKRLDAMRKSHDGSCSGELLQDSQGVSGLMEWSERKTKSWQILITDTDEEGNFSFTNVPPGKYDILVRSRAGVNEAFWNQEVWVAPGQIINAKIASVEHSCSDLE